MVNSHESRVESIAAPPRPMRGPPQSKIARLLSRTHPAVSTSATRKLPGATLPPPLQDSCSTSSSSLVAAVPNSRSKSLECMQTTNLSKPKPQPSRAQTDPVKSRAHPPQQNHQHSQAYSRSWPPEEKRSPPPPYDAHKPLGSRPSQFHTSTPMQAHPPIVKTAKMQDELEKAGIRFETPSKEIYVLGMKPDLDYEEEVLIARFQQRGHEYHFWYEIE